LDRSYGHLGNQHFLHIVASCINDYARADTKQAKSDIVQKIVLEIDDKGGFIRQDETTGLFYRAEDGAGREKTSQALRDCLKYKYKSSKDIKKTNRKAKRMARPERTGRRGSTDSQGTAASGVKLAELNAPLSAPTSGMVTVPTVQPAPPKLAPGFLQSRHLRRNSFGNTANNTASWDAALRQPTPPVGGHIYVTSPAHRQPSPLSYPNTPQNTATNVIQHPGGIPLAINPTGRSLQPSPTTPTNTLVNPWESRSARDVQRRFSASSYFDSNLSNGMGGVLGGGAEVVSSSAVAGTSNSAQQQQQYRGGGGSGVMVHDSLLGYTEEAGPNVGAGLDPGDCYEVQRRTSTSTYESSASSYWSGNDTNSNSSSSHTHYDWAGVWVDEDDETWASDLGLLAGLADDLVALRMVPGSESLDPNRMDEGGCGGVPMNAGGNPNEVGCGIPMNIGGGNTIMTASDLAVLPHGRAVSLDETIMGQYQQHQHQHQQQQQQTIAFFANQPNYVAAEYRGRFGTMGNHNSDLNAENLEALEFPTGHQWIQADQLEVHGERSVIVASSGGSPGFYSAGPQGQPQQLQPQIQQQHQRHQYHTREHEQQLSQLNLRQSQQGQQFAPQAQYIQQQQGQGQPSQQMQGSPKEVGRPIYEC
jgi:hypothetical protein